MLNRGEVIKAFIVKKDQTLTEEEIRKFCHENLTNYKVPSILLSEQNYPKPMWAKFCEGR